MTSKQRAYLKSLSSGQTAIFQIGKSGLTPELTTAVQEALDARELIKINVLKSCAYSPEELAQTLSERTRSQVVQVIGRKIVLYKRSRENQRIILPGEEEKKR